MARQSGKCRNEDREDENDGPRVVERVSEVRPRCHAREQDPYTQRNRPHEVRTDGRSEANGVPSGNRTDDRRGHAPRSRPHQALEQGLGGGAGGKGPK